MKPKINIPIRGKSNPPRGKNLPPSAALEEETKKMEQKLKELKDIMALEQAMKNDLGITSTNEASGKRWRQSNDKTTLKNTSSTLIENKLRPPSEGNQSQGQAQVKNNNKENVSSSSDSNMTAAITNNTGIGILSSVGKIETKPGDSDLKVNMLKGRNDDLSNIRKRTPNNNGTVRISRQPILLTQNKEEQSQGLSTNNIQNESIQTFKNEVDVFLNEINLLKYSDLFKENGFDDMDTLLEITTKHLVDMKIPAGHQIKIMKNLEKIKANGIPNQLKPLETSTITSLSGTMTKIGNVGGQSSMSGASGTSGLGNTNGLSGANVLNGANGLGSAGILGGIGDSGNNIGGSGSAGSLSNLGGTANLGGQGVTMAPSKSKTDLVELDPPPTLGQDYEFNNDNNKRLSNEDNLGYGEFNEAESHKYFLNALQEFRNNLKSTTTLLLVNTMSNNANTISITSTNTTINIQQQGEEEVEESKKLAKKTAISKGSKTKSVRFNDEIQQQQEEEDKLLLTTQGNTITTTTTATTNTIIDSPNKDASTAAEDSIQGNLKSEKRSCWNCYVIFEANQGYKQNNHMYCSQDCYKNYLDANSQKCNNPTCKNQILKQEAYIQKGYLYCNEKCSSMSRLSQSKYNPKNDNKEMIVITNKLDNDKYGNDDDEDDLDQDYQIDMDLNVKIGNIEDFPSIDELEQRYSKEKSKISPYDL